MKIKKKSIVAILTVIALFNDKNQIIEGLLSEDISLGLKRRLQKIRNELLKHYEQLQEDLKDIDAIEDSEQKKKEMDELSAEEVEISQEPVSLAMIEAIQTKANYDWEVIEMIAK